MEMGKELEIKSNELEEGKEERFMNGEKVKAVYS